MKRNLLILFVFFKFFLSCISLHAQTNENIWFDGLSRSYFARDAIDKSVTDDTLSVKSTSNGYSMLDLNTHVNPIKNMEIFHNYEYVIPLEVFWFRYTSKCPTT